MFINWHLLIATSINRVITLSEKLKLFTFLSGLLIILSFLAAAQQQEYINNNMFWSEVNIVGPIKGNFSYNIDYQQYEQAIPENLPGNHQNLARYHLLQTVRP